MLSQHVEACRAGRHGVLRHEAVAGPSQVAAPRRACRSRGDERHRRYLSACSVCAVQI